MRNRRLLRMMAGEVRSPQERRQQRQQIKTDKAIREAEADRDSDVVLRDKILQRQEGKDGLKPMPFAGRLRVAPAARCQCGWAGDEIQRCPKCGRPFTVDAV